MKKQPERAVEASRAEVISFPDRVTKARERAEALVLSDNLPKVLEGAVQLAGFDDDLTTEDDVETAWTTRQQERLAA
ncbi:MAG: hypothetical protein HY565_04130 [Candidatus Kerfeldbacteria bacterium]|nr:hypothetical protein [Candidatus Kerfeldbacteria bacterium]